MLKMGLSSKQVSRDGAGLGWTQNFLESGGLEFLKNPHQQQQQQQQQQQRSQMPPLKCPRCDSLNTKFCYYNNYNRSQPRHFCKSCKRHWTKGGMLRNVPVGGGRKNKRHKTTNTKNNNSKSVGVKEKQQQQQQQQQRQQQQINDCHGLARGAYLEMMTEGLGKRIGMNHTKNISELLNQAFIINPTLDYVNNQNSFMVAPNDDVSSSPIPLFNFTGLSTTFENNPSSSSPPSSSFPRESQSSNVFNFPCEIDQSTLDHEDLANSTTTTTTTMLMPPTSWQVPTTSSFIDSSSTPINWTWEDLNTLITTDLKQPWDGGNQQTIDN